MIDYTTVDLIKSIKRRASIPTQQQLFADIDFVELANDELDSSIVPLLMRVREEYFVEYKDYQIGLGYKFEIPFNAIGLKLRSVCIVVNVGTTSEQIISLPRFDLETIGSNNKGLYSLTNNSPGVTGFYLEDNSVVLYPQVNSYTNGVLRLYFLKRPLKLTVITNSGMIKSINTGTKEIVLSSVPSDWVVGSVLNAVSQVPGFKTTNSKITITSLSNPTVTLDTVEGLGVGDYITLQGYSVIPQIPVEAQKVLAQSTVVKCLEALGDREGMKVAEAKLEQNKQDMLVLISPRVEGASKKVTNVGRGFIS